jgi:hypothetical protein
LHALPEFRGLVAAHAEELARQHDAYLSQTMATAPGRER